MDYIANLTKHGIDSEQLAFMSDWVEYTHGSRHMPWERYLKFWSDAKDKHLMKVFNGELIHKFPFKYEKDCYEMEREFGRDNTFCYAVNEWDDLYEEIVLQWSRKVWGLSPEYDCEVDDHLYRMIARSLIRNWRADLRVINQRYAFNLSDEALQPLYESMGGLTSIRMATTNYMSYVTNCGDYTGVLTFNKSVKDFRLAVTMKPIKIINTFIRYMRGLVDDTLLDRAEEIAERIRLRQSQLLNTKLAQGNMVLSIHPMDFMTMSDNNCDWSSCMRWTDGSGEYHAGTMEMMTSPSVVVAYLESKHDWEPMGDGRTWSNKKWRELFIVTPDFISSIKAYPYQSRPMEKAIIAELMKMSAAAGYPIDGEIVKGNEDGTIVTSDGTRLRLTTQLMYNDTECMELTYVVDKNFHPECDDGIAHFAYGEGQYCIECGKLRLYVDDYDNEREPEDELRCVACLGYVRCVKCGELHEAEDMIMMPDGDYVCHSCYEEYAITCDATGKVFWRSDNAVQEVTVNYERRRPSLFLSLAGHIYLNLSQEVIDQLPKGCIKTVDHTWGGLRYYLVKMPEPVNEAAEAVIRAVQKSLPVQATIVDLVGDEEENVAS